MHFNIHFYEEFGCLRVGVDVKMFWAFTAGKFSSAQMGGYLFVVMTEGNVHTHDKWGQGGVENNGAYFACWGPKSHCLPSPHQNRECWWNFDRVSSTLQATLLFDGQGDHESTKCASLNQQIPQFYPLFNEGVCMDHLQYPGHLGG